VIRRDVSDVLDGVLVLGHLSVPHRYTTCTGGFKGGARKPCPPNLAPNKFQEWLSGASRMQENFTAAEAPPRTPLGELTALPQTPYLVGRRLAAPSRCTEQKDTYIDYATSRHL